MRIRSVKFLFIALLLFSPYIFSQADPILLRYRNDQKGDHNYRRKGTMNGNLVNTLFYNDGQIGQWPFQPSGEWPKGSGHSYIDGLALLIAAEVTAPGNNQVIHPLETSYREWMDSNPVTGSVWGLEPVPGYFNALQGKPAVSNDPNSWPAVWPAALGLTEDWNGQWYGYFGKGIMNADMESFFVMDDSKDCEFTRAPYRYFPIASDTTRGGLGLRVEARGLQYSYYSVNDVIFLHYDIINISDFDYPKTAFGFYTDAGVGGTDDSGDDCASYNKTLDLAYCFDGDGIGASGWQTGYYGYAFLESPGNALNGIDDDQDGLIDERKDDGIDNDGDWSPALDDKGMDGIGPGDFGYSAPDQGEGDGLPTLGEPNFDMTDNHESDQIGLTAVSIYRLGEGGTGGGWPKDDESMWLKMTSGVFDTSIQKSNISMVFASGQFPFDQARRERFSMALLFGENLSDLIENKNTALKVYDSNYKFQIVNVNDGKSETPDKFALAQNYPNPFNPVTTINYSVAKEGNVSLTVYDALGREAAVVVREYKPAGNYSVQFNGAGFSSGVYMYKLSCGDYSETKKFVLMK